MFNFKLKLVYISTIIFLLTVNLLAQSTNSIKTPKEFFGFTPGEDGRLFTYEELISYLQILDEAFRIIRTGGKVLIVDWKKVDMAEGPPAHIRCTPETVENQMKNSGFKHIQIFNELDKHFFVIGEK